MRSGAIAYLALRLVKRILAYTDKTYRRQVSKADEEWAIAYLAVRLENTIRAYTNKPCLRQGSKIRAGGRKFV